MTHRKHTRRPQGELVATTADPSKNPAKCEEAYRNRKALMDATKEYVNVPMSITIKEYVSPEALEKLKKSKKVKYYINFLSTRKEVASFKASEYLEKGFKVEVEIVEE